MDVNNLFSLVHLFSFLFKVKKAMIDFDNIKKLTYPERSVHIFLYGYFKEFTVKHKSQKYITKCANMNILNLHFRIQFILKRLESLILVC